MSWGSLIVALVQAVSKFTAWMQERQLLKAGEAIAIANAHSVEAVRLSKSIASGDGVADKHRLDPGSLSDDDGFKRKS